MVAGKELMRVSMSRPRRWAAVISVAVAAPVVLITAAALGAFSSTVVVTGLIAPRGLTPTDDGGLLIAEVGAGRLLEMDSRGRISVIQDGLPFTLISGPGGSYPAGPSSVVRSGGDYFYVVGEHTVRGFSELYRLEPGEDPEPVTGQEIVGRFPTNPLTNPYDLVAAPGGGFFVSDSGINAVHYISEEGEIEEYVAFPRRQNPQPLNGFSEIDVVPTGLDYGPDGALYVASLTGFPYPQGAAYVYRIEESDADGRRGTARVFAGGFTAATDVTFDEDGSMLVVEFSTDMGTLAQEYDVREADRIPGRLVRWRDGEITVVQDGLVSPTSVAVSGGRIFVSEEFAGRVSEIPTEDPGPGASVWVWGTAVGVTAGVLAFLSSMSWLGRVQRDT